MLSPTALDLSALLSADNTARRAAEEQLDALQASQPQLVASQLVTTLADGAADPMARTLCALLLRRRLPGMLPSLGDDWKASIKAYPDGFPPEMLAAAGGEDETVKRKPFRDTSEGLGPWLERECPEHPCLARSRTKEND